MYNEVTMEIVYEYVSHVYFRRVCVYLFLRRAVGIFIFNRQMATHHISLIQNAYIYIHTHKETMAFQGYIGGCRGNMNRSVCDR